MSRLFGTDGIRGVFSTPPLDEETVGRLAAALAEMLHEEGPSPRLVLGGDTRDSTPTLCRWLADALGSRGVGVTYVGTLPTAGVAYLTRHLDHEAGIVVSASHNPHPDNGIKLIDAAGRKWSRQREAELERRLAVTENAAQRTRRLVVDGDAVEAYLAALRGSVPGLRPLAGLRLGVDAAHGAASPFAGALFEALGASVRLLGAEPDGTNINRRCGSTHPEGLADAVAAGDAELGFALDGDADRALLVDERGNVRDGDAMLYLWASWLAERGELEPPVVIATTMSNLGLEHALGRRGIRLVRCDVGDREVAETLDREGALLGGEQSGHLLHRRLATTGDGLLTALQLARIRVEGDRELAERLRDFERYPQVLRNVPVRSKPPLDELPTVAAARRRVEERLAGEGRLVLRYSGTEPLVRVMLEGSDRNLIRELAEELATTLAEELGVA